MLNLVYYNPVARSLKALKLTGKKVFMKHYTLITGAASGIGYCLALEFAKAGHNLMLVDINQDALIRIAQELTRKFNISTFYIVIDLSKPGAGLKIFEILNQTKIIVDILVNNAGFGMIEDVFEDSDPEKRQAMIQVNVSAVVDLTHYFLIQYFKQVAPLPGRILFVASTSAFQPTSNMITYSSCKAFIKHFASGQRYKLRKTPVSITTLFPGPTKSKCSGPTESKFWKQPETQSALSSRLFDIMKPTTPEEVASAAYYRLMKGKNRVIPGWRNWLGAHLAMLDGHNLFSTMITSWLQSSPNKKPSDHPPKLKIHKDTDDSLN